MKLTILFLLISLQSLAQPGPDNVPCDAIQLSNFSQFADSFEFRVNCFSKIDFSNEMCSWGIAEGNYNTVPQESSKVLFVIYLEGEVQPEKLDCLRLFESAKYRKEWIDRIQFIFVYDQLSGYTGEFNSKETINKLLNYDIRKGFN